MVSARRPTEEFKAERMLASFVKLEAKEGAYSSSPKRESVLPLSSQGGMVRDGEGERMRRDF